jgi:preprotein translocase subunit YajC
MLSNFLLDFAHASDSALAQGSNLSSFMPLILIAAVFYFLVIRPQQKKNKEHQQQIKTMARGAEVITTGGIIGTIVNLPNEGDQLTIEIAKDVQVKISKHYIAEFIAKKESKIEEKKDKKKKTSSDEKANEKAE